MAIWVRSKWTYDELNGKTVEFSLWGDVEGVKNKGTGAFRVHKDRRKVGLIQINIESFYQRTQNETAFNCSQEQADRIEKLAPGSKTDFRLFEP